MEAGGKTDAAALAAAAAPDPLLFASTFLSSLLVVLLFGVETVAGTIPKGAGLMVVVGIARFPPEGAAMTCCCCCGMMPCCKIGSPPLCNMNAVLKIFWTASLLLLASTTPGFAAKAGCGTPGAMLMEGAGMAMPGCGCTLTGATEKVGVPFKSTGAGSVVVGSVVGKNVAAGLGTSDGVVVVVVKSCTGFVVVMFMIGANMPRASVLAVNSLLVCCKFCKCCRVAVFCCIMAAFCCNKAV